MVKAEESYVRNSKFLTKDFEYENVFGNSVYKMLYVLVFIEKLF